MYVSWNSSSIADNYVGIYSASGKSTYLQVASLLLHPHFMEILENTSCQ